MTAEEEATRQKKPKATTQKDQGEVPVTPSPSPGPPVIPEANLGSPILLAPETLSLEVDPAVKRKKLEENQAALVAPMLEAVKEAWGKGEKKKRKRRKHGEEATSPSQSAVVPAPIFVGENPTANVVAPAPEQGKMKQRRVKEQEQSSHLPLPFDVHPHEVREAAEGPKCDNGIIRSSSKKPHMPSNREMPEGLLDAVRKVANHITNSIDEKSNYSSPVGPFLDQFRYVPDRRQNQNSPPFSKTSDHPALSPPRGCVSSEPSEFGAGKTSKAATTSILNASVSLSQEVVQAKDNEKSVKVNGNKKQGKPKPLFRAPDKRSDKYQPVPLDQLESQMETREFTNCLSSLLPVAKAIPTPVVLGSISPWHSVISAVSPSMTAEEEAMRQKKRKATTQKDQGDVPVTLSPSPGPPVILEANLGSPSLLAPETLPSEVDLAMKGKKHEENQAAAVALMLETVKEAGGKGEKKKQKRRKHGEEAISPSLSAIVGAPIFVGENHTANVVAPVPEQGKMKQWWVKEQEQSSHSPLPFDVHPHEVREAAEGPKCDNGIIRSSSKKPRMPSNREIIRMRMEERKQQSLPEGFLDAVRKAANHSSNSIDENSNYSSPVGPLLDQFCYIPDRRQNQNSPPFSMTSDHPALSPPRGCVSSEPSEFGAGKISKAAKTVILNDSVSLSQEAVQAKDYEKSVKANGNKKKRKPNPLFRAADKRSDKYRRVPLDQLVPPPRSPHKLLQEKYASDPWKVIVICMLLNLTQGKQVRKKVKGFFKRYPDPWTAFRADCAKMIEYLTPLGLQNKKTERIQKFSKDYVEKEWTYITELCGVGKYAADAYAIFCAGKATEVIPEDHKLVDYWKYVCFELPLIQGPENDQEPGTTDELEKFVPKVQELAVCC